MRLKELRQSRSLYQKDIAAHLGIDRTTYVKYENGSSEPPLDALIELCKYYSVSLDYLVGLTDSSGSECSENMYTDIEKKLILDFRSMNKQGRDYILQTMAMSVTIYKNGDISDMENYA